MTWAGRKFARVSDNCAKGSRKQADGKRVSTGRLLPIRLSGLRYEHVRGDLGAPGRRGEVWGQGSSLMQERKIHGPHSGQENTAGKPQPQVRTPPLPSGSPQGSAPCLCSQGRRATFSCYGLSFFFNTLQMPSPGGTLPMIPLARLTAEAGLPGTRLPLLLSRTEGALFPHTKRTASKESLRPGPWMGRVIWGPGRPAAQASSGSARGC